MSLRAIIWYYHGRLSDAIGLAEQALSEAGTDPDTRARVLVRLAFLRCQLDVASGLATVNEAMQLLDGLGADADDDLLANAILLRASLQLELVEPMDQDEVQRGVSLISATGRTWERENADGMAFGIARLTDQLDRAIEMTEELIRAKSGVGWDDPFNLVQLSGLLLPQGPPARSPPDRRGGHGGLRPGGHEPHALVATAGGRPRRGLRGPGRGRAPAGHGGAGACPRRREPRRRHVPSPHPRLRRAVARAVRRGRRGAHSGGRARGADRQTAPGAVQARGRSDRGRRWPRVASRRPR